MTIHTLLLFVQLAAPATTPIAAPTLGYTLVNQQVYTITGLPGAAAAVPLPGLSPIRSLASASHVPAAIALPIAADTAPCLITPTHRTTLTVSGITSAATLSPNAHYAALLTTTGLYLLPLSGNAAPEPIVLPQSALSEITLSVSDRGALLVTTPTDLYYWPDSKAQPSHLSQTLTNPRFAPHSNLIAAFGAGPALLLIDPATGLTIQSLASERDGLTAPTSLEFGSDNSLWVTQGSAAPLLHIKFNPQYIDPLPLFVAPFSPLSSGVFLIDPQHILDTNRPTPAVLLLPTPASTAANN